MGLAVVIDARVSRKVGRGIDKRITSRRDPRPFLLGVIYAPLASLRDEFAVLLVCPSGSMATEVIAVTVSSNIATETSAVTVL